MKACDPFLFLFYFPWHLDEMRVLGLFNVKDCAFILLVIFLPKKIRMVDVAKKNNNSFLDTKWYLQYRAIIAMNKNSQWWKQSTPFNIACNKIEKRSKTITTFLPYQFF